MTRNDMLRFVDDYYYFAVEGRKVSSDWMTEMYGYAVAAASHDIKHTILTNLGITHPYLDGHEYWSFLKDDNLKVNPCADAYEVVLPMKPPVGIHFFHLYKLLDKGRYFNKRVVPKDILNYDYMMLEIPKASEYDTVAMLYSVDPPYQAR